MMDPRLAQYINSEGKKFPADIADFTAYGPKAKDCIFCEEPHLKYRILSGPNHEKVFCCSECEFEIDAAFDNEYRDFPSKSDPRLMEEMTIAHDAIVYYIDTGLFPSDVHKFCLKGELSECCVFCGRHFTSAHGGSFLSVPQGPDQTQRVCSDLQICKWCTEDLVMLSQIKGENYSDDLFSEIVQVQCSSCTEWYPVTIEEDEFRSRERETSLRNGDPFPNEYYCSTCLEKHWGKPRFAHINCNSCKKELVIDLLCNISFSDLIFDDIECKECREKNINMIEIPVEREDGDDRDSVKVVITSVSCGSDIRWNWILAYQKPVYSKQVVENSGNKFHKCIRGDPDGDRAECGCCATPIDAAYKGTIEALEFYEK